MTAASILTRAPVAAGGVLSTAASRLGLWVLARIADAPFTSAGLVALTVGGLMASSNALFWQPERHPAPLHLPWSGPVETEAPVIPVGPPVRRAPPRAMLPAMPSVQAAPARVADTSVATETAGQTVTNADVAAVQRKLTELGYFSGQIDGLFGSRTATAIRAFERAARMEPTGMLTPQVVGKIVNAPEAHMVSKSVGAPAPGALKIAATQIKTASIAVAPSAQKDPIAALLKTTNAEPTTQQSEVATQPGNAPSADTASRPQMAAKTTAQTATADNSGAFSPGYIRQVQKGLASLGFLQAPIDGKPGAATAEAIRHFEVFFDYKVTGQITPDLVRLLDEAGAQT